MSAQRGSIFRMTNGLWAIRWRDALGRRPQRMGFRTRGKRARRSTRSSGACAWGRIGRTRRCGALRRYIDQYDVAPSTVAFLKDNMKPALKTFGDERIGELRVDRIAASRSPS